MARRIGACEDGVTTRLVSGERGSRCGALRADCEVSKALAGLGKYARLLTGECE